MHRQDIRLDKHTGLIVWYRKAVKPSDALALEVSIRLVSDGEPDRLWSHTSEVLLHRPDLAAAALQEAITDKAAWLVAIDKRHEQLAIAAAAATAAPVAVDFDDWALRIDGGAWMATVAVDTETLQLDATVVTVNDDVRRVVSTRTDLGVFPSTDELLGILERRTRDAGRRSGLEIDLQAAHVRDALRAYLARERPPQWCLLSWLPPRHCVSGT